MPVGMLLPLLVDAELDAVMGDAACAAAMVHVERALALVQGRLGVIEAADAQRIAAALRGFVPDPDGLRQGTAAAGVPVPALVARLRKAVGGDAGDRVHWGATSQDILDTATVLQLRGALRILAGRLDAAIEALAALAAKHRDTPVMARTRYQQAIPTTFGLKVAGWLAPLLRHRRRLAELRPRLLVVQFGGAAGNLAALGGRGVAVMEGLALELDLGCPPMPWHSQRDGFAEFGGWLALLTGSLGKLGQDVLLLAQNEVGEVREAEGGGSSTMPQKSNPVRAEALVTLARANAGRLADLHQAMLHAHERDGAAWALEWAVLPGMVTAAGSALAHAGELATTLVVDAAAMLRTIDATLGLPLAEAASFALAAHMPRAEAQALVKAAAAEALASGRDLIELLAARSTAPVDWQGLRSEALRPACAGALVDRVLSD